MATYHLSVKSGKRGKACEHANYIAREGKHGKNDKQHDLVALEHGNMPPWAKENPNIFWKMADQNERVNGAAYREFELALPSELARDQQIQLVRDFVQQQVGGKPFLFAIHEPTAALGAVPQPHAHAMFTDRVPDNIERPPEQFFRRYNSAKPELGGCRKDSGGKEPVVLKNELKTLRSKWAEFQNEHLEKHGHQARVDHRSNRDRGIETEAEKHLGAAAITKMADEDKSQITEKRQGNKKSK